jgi:NAD-dependent deacetylase
LQSNILHAAQLIRDAEKSIALTGAGISTPSGIPDFRSSRSGLWQTFNPMEVASLAAFRYQPEKFFEWVRPLARTILEAEPNAAHVALAELEVAGFLIGVVTQNIDDLHGKAGSKKVLEVHGHWRAATCVNCFDKVSTDPYIHQFIAGEDIPHCERCGGVLKPDAILFGEQLPLEVVTEAKALMNSSDLILVVGSSLEVSPVALFPIPALNAGAKLIIINLEPTYLDERASVVFHSDAADILPLIVAEVLND